MPVSDDGAGRPRPGSTSGTPTPRAKRSLGPGLLVAAAFIGPGTVTTATVAGSDFGFQLVWVLVFGVATAMLLQEMSARLGIVSREGLGEAFRSTFANPTVSAIAIVLVVAAIGVGNAAFEAGNIIGAALGLEALTGIGTTPWALLIGVLALLLLGTSIYRVIERALVTLVLVMSVAFVGTFILVRPDLGDLASGFAPALPSGAILTVVALIGTTVVPYNLFLHASSVQEKWGEELPTGEALSAARTDTFLSIGLGGLITLAILSTSAAAFFAAGIEVEDAGTMADQLEPLLGRTSQVVFATGLLAAGLTSAVTAPLAAAYAISGALGWGRDLGSGRFRAIWASIIVIGTIFAVFGGSPVEAIVFAQAANGLVLPFIAVFLLRVMNRRDLLGEHTNGVGGNIVAGVVVLVVSGLGIFNLVTAFTGGA
jgi:manganese transport protein